MSDFTVARADSSGITHNARAIVVVPDHGGQERRSAQARLDEAIGLASAISLDIVAGEVIRLRAPRPATLFGQGQVERLAASVAAHEAVLVVVDGPVTPIQQRNLEKALSAKVIDRTGLILEIFGERAATREGVLQVELAHLDYQAGRLVRSWTHLERQRGGFGFLGGPGETQIETDRRLIRDRMAKLRRELESVKRTRSLHRSRRQRAPWPVVALVGYTNAGKSTLFNRLTGAKVMAEDLLFATLDPTLRAIELPGHDKVMLSDTVGFVSDLPTQLVAAFRATLEEVLSADLVVHVRDRSHPDSEAQAKDVAEVLHDLGLITEGPDAIPLIEAWNKIDLLDEEERAATFAEATRREDVVAISAQSGEGIDHLRQAISRRLQAGTRIHQLKLSTSDGEAIAWLRAHGQIADERIDPDGEIIWIAVRLSDADYNKFSAAHGNGAGQERGDGN